MDKQLKIDIKPILDTNILKKQLDIELPKLKLDIDASYMDEQIQNAVGKLNLSPASIPVHLNVNQKELQSAISAGIAAQERISMVPAVQVQPPSARTAQGTASKMQPAAREFTQPPADTGFFSGMVKTGAEAIGTYNNLAGTIGTLVGLMDGTVVSNFTKSFD